MRSLFTLFIISIFLRYAFSSSYVSMLMYWWVGIFRPQDWMWWDVSFLRIPLIVAGIFFFKGLFFEGFPKIKGAIPFLMILWILLAGISDLLAGCIAIFDSSFSRFFIIIFAVILTERLLTSYTRIYLLVFTVTCSIGIHGLNVGINSLLLGGSSLYGVNIMTGTFSGSNAFSMGTAMVFCLIPFLYLNIKYLYSALPSAWGDNLLVRKGFKYLFLFMGIGCIYTIISLFSRGASIALALGIIVMILLTKQRAKFITYVFLGGLVVLAVVPLPEGYMERIQSVFIEEEEMDKSAKSRPHFWQTARDIASSNPLGVGLGCFPNYYNNYDSSNGQFGLYRSPHSSHFQVLAEVGYMGLFIWFLLFVVSFFKLLAVRRKVIGFENEHDRFIFLLSISVFGLLVVFLFGGLFYELAHNEIIWVAFILVSRISKLILEKNFPVEGLKI